MLWACVRPRFQLILLEPLLPSVILPPTHRVDLRSSAANIVFVFVHVLVFVHACVVYPLLPLLPLPCCFAPASSFLLAFCAILSSFL